MTSFELLAQLRRLDVALWAEGDQLCYDAPEGALTPDLLAQLAADKADILVLLRTAHEAVYELSEPIQPAVYDSDLSDPNLPPPSTHSASSGADRDASGPPLSFAQQRLWFLDQLTPGSTAYNIPTVVQLTGALQVAALQQSLTAIMRRHSALRTTFANHDGQPLQLIGPPTPLPLPLLDLQALPAETREPTAHRLARIDAQQSFDLARGPLLRATLLRLDPQAHILLLMMHHIVSDGWSMGVLVRELVTLYQRGVQGQPMTLPQLPIQYADYAIWQRRWLQGSGDRGQGTGDKGQGDKETRPAPSGNEGRQGDALRLHPQHPTPNTQHPTPIEAQLAYWEMQLAAPPALDLPTDHPRPRIATAAGARQVVALPPALHQELVALSRQADVTLFMTLLAAFAVLLARYSGQHDIVVGSPIANRTHAETEGLIGFFVNTLALRIDLEGNPTFCALLERVREVCLDAYAHQDIPFELLVEAVQPTRDLSRNPLFDVLFALQNVPVTALELLELRLRLLDLDPGTAQFDLSLILAETDAGLEGALVYRTVLFEAARIRRLQQHFQTLLTAVVGSPDLCIAELPLLSAAEREQLLVAWNDTRAVYPAECCIHQLFEQQVERTSDAVAAMFDRPTTNDQRPTTEDRGWKIVDLRSSIFDLRSSILHPPSSILHPQSLTYTELNTCANRLAHHLRSLGVGPEVRVGVCLDRTPTLLIALLGVLKAGGAYVPLDPTYPPERLAFMLDDAQVAVLITTDDRRLTNDQRPTTNDQRPTTNDHPFTLSPCHLVTLSEAWPAIARYAANDPTGALGPDHLAYILYTSGSTGTPKGIQVGHRAFANRLLWSQATYPLGQADRVVQLASISFDISLWELLGPLVAGACVVLTRPGGHQDLAYLIDLIAEQQITVAHFVPSLLQVVLAEPGIDRWRDLRIVFCGGEALPPDLPDRFFAHFAAEFHQFYGPTEAAINATAWDCRQHSHSGSLPIGRPIANTSIYLLDAHLQPVPIGIPGELHIGGAGLARGYLGRPDLTAERFIPNPFAGVLGVGCWVLEDKAPVTQHPTPNTRLYKTGDLARYRPDGAIEFLGRLDQQVKLRGFRIELGEVEAVLAQHPAVRETVVVAREDTPGEPRLVAYVVPKIEDRGLKIEDSGSDAPDPLSSILYPLSSELRRFLQTKLPDYMLPAAFVTLEALPRTPSGKLDRRALPAPGQDRPATGATYQSPRDWLELQLVRIWEELLAVRPIGVADNFFELGGHSLLAVRLVAQIQQRFGRALPLALLFQAPTIERLAGVLRQQPDARPWSPLVGIQTTGDRRPFFCVHPAGGGVLCYVELARQLGPDQPFYGLQAPGMDGEQEPCARVEALAGRYVEALTSVQPEGAYLLGGWSLGGVIAFEMARQLRARGREVALLALLDTQLPPAREDQPADDLELLGSFALDLGLTFDHAIPALEQVRQRAPDERLSAVLEQARQAELLPPDVTLTQIRRLFQVFKANVYAVQRYAPQVAASRITLFRAAAHTTVGHDDPAIDWDRFTTGGLETYVIPGTHYSIVRSPFVQALAQQLRACLDAAQPE